MTDKIGVLNARILYYSLFSKLFVFTYDSGRLDGVDGVFKLVVQSPIDESSKQAAIILSQSANSSGLKPFFQEYDAIFHGIKGGVKNTISYYDEGYEGGISFVYLKRLIAKTNLRRDEEKYKENEDNFGFIFALMSEFLQRQKAGFDEYEEFANELFMEFLNPFVDEFADAIYLNENANLYKEISTLMRSFFEFERIYYGTTKPQKRDNIKILQGISRSEMARRESNKSRKKGAQNG